MGLQRWPGTGTAELGLGTPGNITVNRDLNVITPKQKITPRLISGGTERLLLPINDNYAFDEHSSRITATLKNFQRMSRLGGIPRSLMKSCAYESNILTSPATFDPLIGRKVSQFSLDLADTVSYGDDTILSYYDLSRSAKIISIDLCSPIMQVDTDGIVRTRRGIMQTTQSGDAQFISEGNYMHVSSFGSDLMATDEFGTVTVIDKNTGQTKWEARKSKGSVSAWTRVALGMNSCPHSALWCHRYALEPLDLRVPPPPFPLPPAPAPTMKSGPSPIIDFHSRQTRIIDFDAGISRDDAFALTNYDVRWVSTEGERLRLNHSLNSKDHSLCVYNGHSGPYKIATISSQLGSVTWCGMFGQRDNYPSIVNDAHLVETLPNIVPQSHITIPSPTGCILLSSGARGGLFKQKLHRKDVTGEIPGELVDMGTLSDMVTKPRGVDLSASGPKFATDATGTNSPEGFTLPVATQVEIGCAPHQANRRLHALTYQPFQLRQNPRAVFFYNFERIYKYAFGDLPPQLIDTSEEFRRNLDSTRLNLIFADSRTPRDVFEHGIEMWITPLEKKAALNGKPVNELAVANRLQYVKKIAGDMVECAERYIRAESEWTECPPSTAPKDRDEDIDKVVALWPDEDEAPAKRPATQQQQDADTSGLWSSSQPNGPMSQPMPMLGASKKKKRHQHKVGKKKKSKSSLKMSLTQ